MLENSIRFAIAGTVGICRDPNDNMVPECAEPTGAELIVTGDKDLLVIEAYKQTKIITPSEYLAS